MKLKKILPALIILTALAINFVFGFPRLARFSAVDEHLWTYERTPQFWNAVTRHNWKSTHINDKPGVTAALISGIGMLAIDPLPHKSSIQAVKSDAEIKNIEKINLDFRLPVYLFALLMAPVFYILLKKLFNQTVALFSVIIIYLSPIILGISLFVNPDSLFWIFVPLSIVSFLLFQKTEKSKFAGLAGLFFGLALLTKYVSAILYIFFLLLLFLDYIFCAEKSKDPKYFKKSFIGYGITLIISTLVVAILYPATWVNPKMLWGTTFLSHPFKPIAPFFVTFLVLLAADTFFLKNRIFSLILSPLIKYKKSILQLTVFLFLAGILFILVNTYSGMPAYDFQSMLTSAKIKVSMASVLKILNGGILTGAYVLIFSLTPLVFLFFVYSLWANLSRKDAPHNQEFLPTFYLLVFILLYYSASAANNVQPTVRYQIAIYPLAAVIAAIGAYQFINLEKVKKYLPVFCAYFLLIIISATSLILIKPYYFAYASDLLPKKYVLNLKDMGDGSFEAAQYLNNLPDAQNLSIWSDKVAVCEYFVGQCSVSLKIKNTAGLYFDYFVISHGREAKSGWFVERRGITAEDFANLGNFYQSDNFMGRKIEIDGRPDNFVKIIKNPAPRKNESSAKIPFAMPQIPEVSIPDRACVITDYGAVGDGKFANTKSFEAAITDCAQKGGGKVTVPPGIWLTGPIHLQSNIELHLENGAKILFSKNFSDYRPSVFTRFEGTELYNYSPLVYAKDCQNIALTGSGELDGQGDTWIKWNNLQQKITSAAKLYAMAENDVPVEERIFGKEENPLQPSFIQFINCDKVLVDGIKITNSPSWTIHPIYSSNIIVRNVNIENGERNTDGVAIDSSRNVLVENSILHTGDDAIVIKSGKDKDGRRVGRPSENVIIHDIKIEKSHGGIALGSEMSGDIRNVFAYNIDIGYADYGIRLKSMRGRGGVVEKIWLQNINLNRAVYDAIQMDMNYGTPPLGYDKTRPPVFRNISIKDMTVRRAKNAAFFNGLPESPLENITLENIKISATNGITFQNLKSRLFKNVEVKTGRETSVIND